LNRLTSKGGWQHGNLPVAVDGRELGELACELAHRPADRRHRRAGRRLDPSINAAASVACIRSSIRSWSIRGVEPDASRPQNVATTEL
jgi:hypothetical protein